jgi:phytoene/squalene synthetase
MNGDPFSNYHDQFVALRRELRELDPFDRDRFRIMAAATAKDLSEGRASTATSNVPEVLDCCRRLASHLGAVAEVIGRRAMVDIIISKERKTK